MQLDDAAVDVWQACELGVHHGAAGPVNSAYGHHVRDHDRPRADLSALLERVEAASPTDAIAVVAAELADIVGARAVTLLIADFSGRAIVRFGTGASEAPGMRRHGTEQAETVPLVGTAYDRVLRTQQVNVDEIAEGARLIVPVTDRGDAIGLIELVVPRYPDEQMIADVAATAHALAYVIIANRRHTDLFEWGQRTTPFSLAAEIQRRLLPASYTCEDAQFTLAGWLEPASTVGGDTFDYNLDHGVLQLSITDAVGHEVEAALLATLLVGSLRNGRRRGLDLLDQAENANDALAAHARIGQFVTGQLLRVDLEVGTATIINAGHPLPLRLRDGRVEEVDLEVDLPFGLQPGRSFRIQAFPLRSDDRIVFVTDGMLERDAADLDVANTLRDTRHLHPRELVHALGAAVLRATGGDLRDDATVVVLDWYGGGLHRRRDSTSGASRQHTSP
jgi:serine phosphatase RsbU (regulator of sigma subunit)